MERKKILETKIPTSVFVSKRKKFYLNLNNYRNAHYQTKNKAKREFERVVYPILPKIRINTAVKIVYTLFVKDNRRKDLSNVLSIADKFFSDILVEKGIIEDDSLEFVDEVVFRFGGKGEDMILVEVFAS